MNVIADPRELRERLAELRASSRAIAFVPTMGALHDGHLSLVKRAHAEGAGVVVSIFVNPTQFGPTEDYRVYPRTLEKDCELLAAEAVDVVFTPTAKTMYPDGKTEVTVHPGPVGDLFEGKTRPGHFAGVLTVVAKLFHLVGPDVAVFGQKDAQQLYLIRKMVADLDFPARIVAGETAREADGLARSSRNVYLKAAEREKATVLYRALQAGRVAYAGGARELGAVQAAMRDAMAQTPEFQGDYATVVGDSSFQEADPVAADGRLIIAGRLGSVRLIDNMRLIPLSENGTDER